MRKRNYVFLPGIYIYKLNGAVTRERAGYQKFQIGDYMLLYNRNNSADAIARVLNNIAKHDAFISGLESAVIEKTTERFALGVIRLLSEGGEKNMMMGAFKRKYGKKKYGRLKRRKPTASYFKHGRVIENPVRVSLD